MNSISLKAPAKINLSLDIISKRQDGYHDLSMIMQSVSLYDIISIRKNENISVKDNILTDEPENKIKINCDIKNIPTDKSNIVYKCTEAFFKYTDIKNQNLVVNIVKKIPSAAGLAGGSSDGAAVLAGLNILFKTNLDYKTLCFIGEKIGADIPFCITGGTALCEGIGEKITPLIPLTSGKILLCKPDIDVSTKEIFSKVNIKNIKNHPDKKLLLKAVNSNDLPLLCENMYNCLEEITSSLHHEIADIKNKMRLSGCIGTMMSGSGPTVFGIFDSEEKCRKTYTLLKKEFKECYIADFCGGIEITDKGE